MAEKNKKKRSDKVRSPTSSTAEERFSVLLEQVLEQSRGIFQAVQSLEQKMERRFTESAERSDRGRKSFEATLRMDEAMWLR